MFAFLPVTDLAKMLAALEPMIGKAHAMPATACWKSTPTGQTIYLKEKEGGWVFIAREPRRPGRRAGRSDGMLKGLQEQYDLAVRVSVANIPPIPPNDDDADPDGHPVGHAADGR